MISNLGTILLIDDDRANRDMLRLRLSREGYSTATVEGGSQALNFFNHQTVDLVLLDVNMPDMNGLTVLRHLRQRYSAAELPIIMVTANQQSEDVVEALTQGANDYVTKPIDFPVVLARIRTQLCLKQEEDELRESEERYALAFRSLNEGLWDWNLSTNEIYYAPHWKAMVGCSDSAIGSKPDEWFSRVHPDDLPRVRADLAAHLDGLTSQFESEHRLLHQDGSYHWMFSRGLAVRNQTGRINRIAGSMVDITENKLADPLTGLPNRLLFLDRLGRAIERAKRHKDYVFAVLLLTLNRFNIVNDSLGHDAGDQLLSMIACRLETRLRSGDTVARPLGSHTIARLDGDEFAILLDDIKYIGDATRVADRLQRELTAPFHFGDHEVFTTVSIGIALSTTGYERAEEFLRDASTAMHRAKSAGNAGFEVFDTAMHTSAMARLQLETDLRRGIERQEFRVYYQPIISLSTGRIIAFESLLRWQHPQRGLVPPLEFIYLAEETGLIVPLGTWVLNEACKQLCLWQAQLPPNISLQVSVNVSGKQLYQPQLVEQISQMLQTTGVAAESLKLELTESVLMADTHTAATVLEQLRGLGIQLSIDDFGTGYSSLSYLHEFPFDWLKIDRSFISQIGTNNKHPEIVRTIVELAHNLELGVVAEGIETAEHLAHLRRLGCEYGQGYFFSKPVDSHTAGILLASNPCW